MSSLTMMQWPEESAIVALTGPLSTTSNHSSSSTSVSPCTETLMVCAVTPGANVT